MTNKKSTGSFYTPPNISDFMVDYVNRHLTSKALKIFEPSAGNGQFIASLLRHNDMIRRVFKIVAIEKEKRELEKVKKLSEDGQVNCICTDFLEFQKEDDQKFDLVIGNPPYIRKGHLSSSQIKKCKDIHTNASLSSRSIHNIWTAFLIRCSEYLTSDGILAFVLPAELLQMNFTEEIRKFLQLNFSRTEIFTFDDLLFDCKGQDTVILFAYKKSSTPGQYFTHIKDTSELASRNFRLRKNVALEVTNTKWTHHQLAAEDISFLSKIRKRLDPIQSYSDIKPGIVTAANNFFIVDELTEKFFELGKYAYPIIQKGHLVNGSVTFKETNFRKLVSEGKPNKVLCFKESDEKNFSELVKLYLEMGISIGLPKNHKCNLRDKWFVIPNISSAPDGFFFRRVNLYPKLLKNEAKVLVTDSAYKVNAKDGHEINDIIYSFYNSLTLTFAELEGRYYGGRVLELTPQEFKKLPLPKVRITNAQFNDFTKRFSCKDDISDILESNDLDILHASLGLSSEEVRRIEKIYNQVINKRFRIS